MKYIFKPVNIEEHFVVGHQIFLDKSEMELLRMPGTAVETVGVYTPTWHGKSDNLSDEVFAKYRIFSDEDTNKLVSASDEGWHIFLNKKHTYTLLTNKFIALIGRDNVVIEGKEQRIVSQITISDVSVLEDNMYCLHFPQTVSK